MIEKVMAYFGNTFYPVVLILLILYLICHFRHERSKLILFSVGLLIVLFPVLYIGCNAIGQGEEVYRFLWLLPLSMIWAFLMVEACKKANFDKIVMTLAASFTVLLFGTVVLLPETWNIPGNPYFLEDEIIRLAEIIDEDCDGKEVRIIAEPQVMIQVRQYQSNLCWAYTGRGQMMMAEEENVKQEMVDDPQYRLAMSIQQEVYLNESVLRDDMESLSVDYVIVSSESTFIDHIPKGFCIEVGKTRHYRIYKTQAAKRMPE